MGRHLSVATWAAVGEVDKEQEGQVALKSTHRSIFFKKNEEEFVMRSSLSSGSEFHRRVVDDAKERKIR
jgi:hypothetical protein